MESSWRNLNELGLLNLVFPFSVDHQPTLAARFIATPQTVLTNSRLSSNAAVTVTLNVGADQPLIAAYGIYLFNVTPGLHFPYGASVEPP